MVSIRNEEVENTLRHNHRHFHNYHHHRHWHRRRHHHYYYIIDTKVGSFKVVGLRHVINYGFFF